MVGRAVGLLFVAVVGCGRVEEVAVEEAGVVAREAPAKLILRGGSMDGDEGCPEELGVGPRAPVDADGDGIADGDDRCPTQAENRNGFQDRDGCEDVMPMELVHVGEMQAEPSFAGNTARLSRKALRWLEGYAEILGKYPDVEIEVSAHSRTMRSREVELELTQRRAEAVVDELVRLGVARERLTARGAGTTESYCCRGPCDGPQRFEMRVVVE
ncbi:OmpA family protein [Nannocystis punicea]|uniref:OmpA family protein n=1 Tax=Nannocystis punicea TaxID=2995304 RepID=A0ABY7H457_9BACT|nr:OmpA family protein [Nannocystis poenicansa]WAS94078.1 OmpA family protein [Nannocystis poenicansa]